MKNKLSIRICVSYLLSIGVYFWSQSRYPQLEGKSGAGLGTPLPDFLAFDKLIGHTYGENIINEILISFNNWAYTNWKGMVFGLFFAIGILSLLHFIDLEKFPKNKYILALIGFLNGVGLGVCANCSTPIGKSIISSGLNPTVAVNTIVSSPSFNVVGISMLFTIFPWYIALSKIIFYCVIVFFIVPNIFTNGSLKTNNKVPQNNVAKCVIEEKSQKGNYAQELIYLSKVFVKNSIFIFKKTLPLMVAGGLIGVSIMVLLPEDIVNQLRLEPLHIILVGIIGFLLPVPMLFDIIFPGIVYYSSLPSIFSLILLFTLGGFSIYPILVLKQNIKITKLLSFSIIFIILALISASGIYAGKNIYESQNIENKEIGNYFYHTPNRKYRYSEEIEELSKYEIDKIFGETKSKNVKEILPKNISINKHPSIDNINTFDFLKNDINSDFTLLYSEELGIDNSGYRLSLMFSGVGVSDYNKDHWQDIVLGSANGVKIYKNTGGSFQIDSSIILGEILSSTEVSQANFYDLDGDSWKDLFIATRTEGLFILWNNEGNISIEDSLQFDITKDENYSYGISFGDIFDDGRIDIFIGEYGFLNREDIENFILKNNGSRNFVIQKMGKKLLGSTLSGLIWDFDDDGRQEIYEGNDFSFGSDAIYDVSNTGDIDFHKQMLDIIPVTTYSNMGITIGDIDNDLLPEFFISGNEELDKNIDKNKYSYTSCKYPEKSGFEDLIKTKNIQCETIESVLITAIRKECQSLKNEKLKNLCDTLNYSRGMNKIENMQVKKKLCEGIEFDYHFQALYDYCSSEKNVQIKTKINDNVIPQINKNVLLSKTEDGTKNITSYFESEGIGEGWSWGAFFADINKNKYQDLYIGNGHIRNSNNAISNKMLINTEGKLLDKTKEYGLQNFVDTLTASYIDYDNDGDLDIINTSIFGELLIYKNNLNQNKSIIIQLVDTKTSNTAGIGSKIIITHKDGTKQIRHIYIGGHLLSLQSSDVFFGTAEDNELESIEIIWGDGEKTFINEQIKTNKKYIIKR